MVWQILNRWVQSFTTAAAERAPRSRLVYVQHLRNALGSIQICTLYSELAVASQIGVEIDILGVELLPWLRCGVPILNALSMSK
jgi:hypothetical protein